MSSHLVQLSLSAQGPKTRVQWELKARHVLLARHTVSTHRRLFHVTGRHCLDKGRPVGKVPTVLAHRYFSSLTPSSLYSTCYII